ncbi:MAG: T9SS type A sorting domain-containing protein, partial [Bacteroidota bacterium]|nr:T9SS type A sorting domain-containing protein [Bacteroidota bacterium]
YTLNGSLTTGTPLPLHKLELKGVTENKQHKFDWQIIADEKVVSQTLELATDGINFQTIASVNTNSSAYLYSPINGNLFFYRLNVIFDNGRQYYSNVITLKNNGANSKPFMIGNLVAGSMIISSPSDFNFTIHDLAGRTISKGILTQGMNTISTGFISRGLYLIQYYNNGELYTERFTKQ